MKIQKQLEIGRYHSSDGFINHYQRLVKDEVIPYQYEILNDRIDGVEKSHVVANFVNAAKALKGEDVGDGFYGMVFQDSDAGKWIEAVAYSLIDFPDKELEQKADDLIDIIAAAQDSDGYLNNYYTIKDRDKRWKNLCEGHELYCSGHMMEAAVAYFEATGKRTLLDVMERNAEHIYKHFVTDKNPGYPGHPEVELALLRMYRATGNGHCLELAQHFIDVRGVDPDFFANEGKLRDWNVWGNDGTNTDYHQCTLPVRQQKDATGHAVRAVYLYTAMADLASETDDQSLIDACNTLWSSITDKRMYVTGGIGSTGDGEAFTVDFDLPNDTAYCETCASIGLMFFASRMLEISPEARYADVCERAFYNTVLAGIQLDGKKFFYVNPLEVILGVTDKAATHKHVKALRPSWYACACCPPNLARLVASFGRYAYGENDTTAFCHLFAEGSVSFENGLEMECITGYPYEFEVSYEIKKGGKKLAIRIPDWSDNTVIRLNNREINPENKNGYAIIPQLLSGDKVTVILDDSVRKTYASSNVFENTGDCAVEQGPLVYCFEDQDNAGDVLSLSIAENGKTKAEAFDKNLLCGARKISVEGYITSKSRTLYSNSKPEKKPYTLTAIPYYTWGNRGETNMRVWLPER